MASSSSSWLFSLHHWPPFVFLPHPWSVSVLHLSHSALVYSFLPSRGKPHQTHLTNLQHSSERTGNVKFTLPPPVFSSNIPFICCHWFFLILVNFASAGTPHSLLASQLTLSQNKVVLPHFWAPHAHVWLQELLPSTSSSLQHSGPWRAEILKQ